MEKRYLFDNTWFAKHQSKLLWLCNTPIVKYWFRRVLWIHNRTKSSEKVVKLSSHYYEVDTGLKYIKLSTLTKDASQNPKYSREARKHAKATYKKILKGQIEDKSVLLPTRRMVVKTHHKFAKRILFAFYPIWWLAHQWDMLIANPFKPTWNLGFDTLSVNPDASTGATTCDAVTGSTGGTNQTWSTIRGASGDFVRTDGFSSGLEYLATCAQNSPYTNTWSVLARFHMGFDTSPLTGTVTAASLIIRGTAKQDANGYALAVNVYKSTYATDDTIVASDYTQVESTALCDTEIAYASYATAGDNTWALNATGIATISLVAVTKLVMRFVKDASNTAPGNGTSANETQLEARSADYTGTGDDPELSITYTPNTAYELAMGQGSFTLTGQTVALKKDMHITIAQGAYTLTGQALSFIYGRTVALARGLFTLSGQNLNFTKVMHLTMAAGTFAVTGIALTISAAYRMTIATGYYVLTGIAQILRGAWDYRDRSTTSFSNKAKNSTTFSQKSKNTTSWTYKNET